METLKRFRWPIIGAVLAVAILAFLAFRPDKLFIDDAVDESLADAFTTTTAQNAAPEPPATSTTTSDTTQAVQRPDTQHVVDLPLVLGQREGDHEQGTGHGADEHRRTARYRRHRVRGHEVVLDIAPDLDLKTDPVFNLLSIGKRYSRTSQCSRTKQ